MPFDEPRDHGGGGGEDWFFIAKALQEDVPRGCPVSVIYDGRLAAFTARETLPKGLAVNFSFLEGIVSVSYEMAPGERRYTRGSFE